MIIYNITFFVDNSVAADAIEAIISKIVPAAERAGLKPYFVAEVGGECEPGITRYAMHLQATSMEQAQAWTESCDELAALVNEAGSGKIMFFGSFLHPLAIF